MGKQEISPGAQSVVKLKETQKGWVVTYKDIVLHSPLPREEAANARMRIIRAMNRHAGECETIGEKRGETKADLQQAIDAGILEAATNAAYERGRAAERERIVPLLNARKQTAAVSETRAQQNNKPHIALVYHNEVEVWDEAITIVNQTE